MGQRLELVRKREGMTQGAFAELLGISRTSLQSYVKGEREISVSILATLLETYSIDPSWMIRGDLSEGAMKHKAEIFEQIKEIGLAVERRADELDIRLSAGERWRLVTQIYTMAIVQHTEFSMKKMTSAFFIESMLRSNGYG